MATAPLGLIEAHYKYYSLISISYCNHRGISYNRDCGLSHPDTNSQHLTTFWYYQQNYQIFPTGNQKGAMRV